MQKFANRPFSYLSAFLACFIMTVTSGCASGGFKLTRQYAGFVNKQQILIRIVLYLLTGIIFTVTLLVDMVIFNTMDFWEGRVSAGSYEYKDGEKLFHAKHEVLPESGLKRSTIHVMNVKRERLQEIVLHETTSGEIEVIVDGQLRGRVHGISDVPIATAYGAKGEWLGEHVILSNSSVARNFSELGHSIN